jgi:hypothetical protein
VEPVIKRRGSGYKISWENGVDVYASRIRENPERLKCEVAIFMSGQPLTRSSPVLTSESGKDSLIRKLNRRRPFDDYSVNWDVLVEELAALVVDTHRSGEPEIGLSDVRIGNGLMWRIEGVLPENQPSLLYGDGGNGKSMYAIFLSVLVDSGYLNTELNLGLITQGSVLYLDYETDQEEIAKRVHAVQKGLGIENKTGIIYRRCSQPFASELDRILDIVDQKKIDFIVVDSLGLATGGSLEDAETTLAFFGALRQIGRTSLVISHTNKSGQPFGSVYATNASRMVLEASGSKNEDGGIDLSIFHRKSNNVPAQAPMGWHIAFEDDGEIVFERKDVFDTGSAGKLTASTLVAKIVQRSGKLQKQDLISEVSRILDKKPDTIVPACNTALSRMKKAGRITITDNEILFNQESKELLDLDYKI